MPPNCSPIDPTGVLAKVAGDFELSLDPDDPAGNVIFTSNMTGGITTPQNLIVARLDGMTGMLVPGSLTVIANNFAGDSNVNGGEWFRTPQGALGVLYPSTPGLALALRAPGSQVWNGFTYDYTGAPSNGSPPPLPNTSPGSYVNPPIVPPTTESYYSSFGGTCSGLCVANYQSGATTDVARVLASQGYSAIMVEPAIWDGYFYYSACKPTGGSCGLYTATIDGKGGLAAQTLLVKTANQGLRTIAAFQHPVTGVAVIFAPINSTSIGVWTQTSPSAPMVQLATVPVLPGAIHFRTLASKTLVVLTYLIEPAAGTTAGTYTIAVSANNGVLSAGPANLVSASTGTSELDWYPASNTWRLVTRQLGRYYGCLVTP